MRRCVPLIVLLLGACGLQPSTPAASPPDLARNAPVLSAVSPARWSRTTPTVMTITGKNLDAIPAAALWSFPGCYVKSYVGTPMSSVQYQIELTPESSKAAVGDVCSLRLESTGQTLPNAFTTWQ